MKKIIASIMMVVGTTIGGGMIVLPAVIGVYGYWSAVGLLLIVWLLNTMIALTFLEANCYLKRGTGLISMSRQLLGKFGAGCAWVFTLLFLYTILCVYITGITEITREFIWIKSSSLSTLLLAITLTSTLSILIYLGMDKINRFNQWIVIGMFISFFILVLSIMSYAQFSQLLQNSIHFPATALPIVFSSFGFLIIIPTLRDYLDNNIKQLKRVIVIGSFIPLVIYILWLTMVMGIIPITGGKGLQMIISQPDPVYSITNFLITYTGNSSLALLIKIFVLLAILSSYIGISLGLFDFLADGLKIVKNRVGKLKLHSLTFLPPLFIMLLNNHLFLVALGFAGLISSILFGIYPILLTCSGRYIFRLPTDYYAPVNRALLCLLMFFSLAIISIEVISLKLTFS